MKKPGRCRSGFTLIEVIAAAVLLTLTASAFMMMMAVNTKLLVKEHKIERSGYQLSAMAQGGEGEATGETLAVEFIWEDSGEVIEEIFEEYSVSEKWEDVENSMTFYRHKLR